MIFFSFGLPSAFADWCETIVTELAQHAVGPIEFVNANTLEDVGESFVKARTSNIVFCSRLPSTRLCRVLAETQAPFLFVLDDPRAAIAYLTVVRGWEFFPTVKLVASSYAAAIRYADLSNALRLEADRHRNNVLQTINQISRHFNLPATDGDILEIAESVRERYRHPAPSEVETWWHSLDEPHCRVIEGAIDGYRAYFSSGRLSSLTWGRELFLAADTHKPLMGAVDITGRARLLVFGPYINLPTGNWTAHVVFGCSNEAAGVSILVDAFSGVRLAQTRVQPAKGGIFAVALKFAVDQSLDGAVEIRILSEKSALDGLLSLSHVTLICENDPAPRNSKLGAELRLEASS